MAGDLDTAIQAASQAYGIPAPILYGHAMAESGGNPDVGNSKIAPAIGDDTHTGGFQISGDMARKYGGDPNDVNQAAMMAARALRENLDHFGNLDDASRAFHGGWNPANWKARTEQNYNSVVKYANAYTNRPQGAPTTPPATASNQFDDAFTAGTNAAPKAGQIDSTNPYDVAFSGGNSVPDASVPDPSSNPVSNLAPSGGATGASANIHNGVAGQRSWGQWAAALTPETDLALNGGSYLADKRDQGLGFVRGINNVIRTGEYGVGGLLDHVIAPISGLVSQGASDMTHRGAQRLYNDADQSDKDIGNWGDPTNPSGDLGELAGSIVGTAPVAGLKVFQAAEGAPALAQALARYGNLSAQGTAMGGLNSGGHNVLRDMTLGGVLAPVLGYAGDKIVDAATPRISDLASAIKGTFTTAKPPINIPDTGAQAGQQIAAMIKNGEPDSVIQAYAAQHGFGGGIDEALAFRAKNGKYTPGVVLQKAPITPAAAADALGSRGSRTGIESNPGLTPDVQTRTDALRGQGVSDEQALRQAHIEAAGASPTTADVTRDPMLVRQTKEGAKLDTPEGLALSQRAAENNAAIDSSIRGVVNDNGGAPVAGQAMEGAASSLAAASDAKYAGVDAAYKTARAQYGDTRTDPTELRSVLSDPMNQAAVTNEGSAFIGGIAKRQNILNPTTADPARTGLGGIWDKLTGKTPTSSPKGMTMDELEQLRQSANAAYDPTGMQAERNSLITKVKGAIDIAQDRLGETNPGFKAARAAYKDWASTYDKPEGVASLIARDDKGNFINQDNWRATDGLITKASDKHFVQIANQLKANGDTAAVGALKAHVVQKAYETATGKSAGTAVDQMGNSVVRGSQFLNNLNQVGKAKLDVLFKSAEQSQLAALGHAASHINEAVPGTVNTSNTAATTANLAQALLKSKEAGARAKSIPGFSSALTGAVPGLMMNGLEGGAIGAGVGLAGKAVSRLVEPIIAAKASSKAAADLANALRGAASPDVARKVEEDQVKELAQVLIARSRVGGFAGRSGVVVSDRQRTRVH